MVRMCSWKVRCRTPWSRAGRWFWRHGRPIASCNQISSAAYRRTIFPPGNFCGKEAWGTWGWAAFSYDTLGPGERLPAEDPPEGLDWNFWCGPAPLRPDTRAIHPRGFRRYLAYSNGQLGDCGVHWLDQMLWLTGEQWPKRVYSAGGRRVVSDGSDAPDTQVVNYEFESFNAVWEHRYYGGNPSSNESVGCDFYGTEGTLHLGWRDGWTFYPSKKGRKTVHETRNCTSPTTRTYANCGPISWQPSKPRSGPPAMWKSLITRRTSACWACFRTTWVAAWSGMAGEKRWSAIPRPTPCCGADIVRPGSIRKCSGWRERIQDRWRRRPFPGEASMWMILVLLFGIGLAFIGFGPLSRKKIRRQVISLQSPDLLRGSRHC